jgi:hypothetical protein
LSTSGLQAAAAAGVADGGAQRFHRDEKRRLRTRTRRGATPDSPVEEDREVRRRVFHLVRRAQVGLVVARVENVDELAVTL